MCITLLSEKKPRQIMVGLSFIDRRNQALEEILSSDFP